MGICTLEWVCRSFSLVIPIGKSNKTFSAMMGTEQLVTREDAEGCYLSYAFLRQSSTKHVNLKVGLQNDFTTGDNRYPKNRQ